MTLLQAGADPSLGNCLQSFLKNYKLRENVELFLELLKRANPNMYSGSSSILLKLPRRRNEQLVEELLRYRADVNFVDSYGKSALHYACDIGDQKLKTKIQALQLPKTIRSFLNLTECMPDEENIMLDKTISFDSALYGYSDPTDLYADDYFYDEFVDDFLW
ncbi:unnamed protein product [Mytilus edulis]|uniref:Uncharacterized protein n=1 Tax=Mytilus edulis TaxID=6550 RepID=A0A8S3PXY4_MYTED|nr:unnamed protein product [Mytilus edulis]